jgi:hypothetical protein
MSDSALLDANFQLKVSSALLQVSPGLSALHAARFRSLNPSEASELDDSHCPRCSNLLLKHAAYTGARPTQKKRERQSSAHYLSRTCPYCRYETKVTVDNTQRTSFPAVWRRKRDSEANDAKRTIPSTAPVDMPPTAPLAPTTPPVQPLSPPPSTLSPVIVIPPPAVSSPSTEPKSSSRPKKKSGLQRMLAQNRERAEQERKQAKSAQSGLSAFLSGI